MKSKLEQHDTLLAELSHDVNELKVTVRVLSEKQGTTLQKHEGIKNCLRAAENRLHALENFMLSSTQRMAFVKTLFKFWPVLIATLLFFFSIGIFVDDQKVASEIADKIELKRS